MTHWQEQFEQSPQTKLFLPRTPRRTHSPFSWSVECPLCHQLHGKEDQSDGHRPSADDVEGWKLYWTNKDQPWRTEPEISACRQYELSQRRLIQPEPEKAVYSFGGVPLDRADVEWLLATHEGGQGPINWNDESHRGRKGLDLRGARLEDVDLEGLPLAKLQGGSSFSALSDAGEKASICLIRANLSLAHLEGADLIEAHLEEANLSEAHLEETYLNRVHLDRATLREAHLDRATLREAHLEGATLQGAYLNKADLIGANLEGAYLREIHLEGAYLKEVHLDRATLREAHLEGARLQGAYLNEADLRWAHLEGAHLSGAHLEGAVLRGAYLDGALLIGAYLNGADLWGAHLDGVQLTVVTLADARGIGPVLADVRWGETNLTVAEEAWSQVRILGDEDRARQPMDLPDRIVDDEFRFLDREKRQNKIQKKRHMIRYLEYQKAYRANHQLSVVLQDQGLTPHASRFAYRAKCLERIARWYELLSITWREQYSSRRTVSSVRKGLAHFFLILPAWLFSWFLFLIAGYGYRLRYCLLWYVLVIGGCALSYLLMEPHYFTWWTALAESVNVFHGRGASPSLPQLAHPARFAMLTVAEAWAGLVIEVVLVATLIRRFFGK